MNRHCYVAPWRGANRCYPRLSPSKQANGNANCCWGRASGRIAWLTSPLTHPATCTITCQCEYFSVDTLGIKPSKVLDYYVWVHLPESWTFDFCGGAAHVQQPADACAQELPVQPETRDWGKTNAKSLLAHVSGAAMLRRSQLAGKLHWEDSMAHYQPK